MTIRIIREPSISGTTLGHVFIDDRHFCYSLEDEIRDRAGVPVEQWKVPGQTAIPAGRYRVLITPSPKFKRDLPLIVKVPGFDGIRIHPANEAKDVEGCIGMGMSMDRQKRCLYESAACCRAVQAFIEAAAAPTWIVIENPLSYTA